MSIRERKPHQRIPIINSLIILNFFFLKKVKCLCSYFHRLLGSFYCLGFQIHKALAVGIYFLSVKGRLGCQWEFCASEILPVIHVIVSFVGDLLITWVVILIILAWNVFVFSFIVFISFNLCEKFLILFPSLAIEIVFLFIPVWNFPRVLF